MPTEVPGLPETSPPAAISAGNGPVSEAVAAVVLRVVDGDTIDVAIEGTAYRVRYIGIDTPERGMPFYLEATAANAALVANETVYLVKDISETDHYGRLLAYVYLVDGTFVNAELVRLGFAQVATFPPDVAHQDEFVALQREARETESGLWASDLGNGSSTTDPLPDERPPTTPPQPGDLPPVGAIQITDIFYNGLEPYSEGDEYAEFRNTSSEPVDLAGWRLNAGGTGQDFWFPPFTMRPGQTCRVYTNRIVPEYCGFTFGPGTAVWSNSSDCGYMYDSEGNEIARYCY